MNNKGFASSTMLYGTFILFLMLMLAMLGILNTFKDNMDILIDGNNGARDIVSKKCSDLVVDTNGNGKYGMIDSDGDGNYDVDERVDKSSNGLTIAEFEKILTFCGYEKETAP